LAGVQPPGTCSPEVTDWEPKLDAEPVPGVIIFATITSACGVDIDQSSIRMTLNDAPISPTLSGGGSEVTATYIVPFGLPTYENSTVSVTAEDVNGASVTKTWSFFVTF
jgi:hypothetical protein